MLMRPQATASGAPPAVTLALLVELEGRLRLKAALVALRAAAVAAGHRSELLESREGPAGPLAAAAWRCWWRSARWRRALRGRVQAAATRRWGSSAGPAAAAVHLRSCLTWAPSLLC